MAFTEEQLAKIEMKINGEECPEEIWFVETIQTLVNEVRRLQDELKYED